MLDDDFKIKSKGINIEPEILLDQKARYLNHLNEIRRINEGDDTADSPGYSLNLVRVPVSLMPGTRTRTNHGAEITITATPHVTEELLPVTFRQLVINDLVDLLSPVVRKFAEELPDLNTSLEEQAGRSPRNREALLKLSEFLQSKDGERVRFYYGENNLADQIDPQNQHAGVRASRTLDDQTGSDVTSLLDDLGSTPEESKDKLSALIGKIGQEIYSLAPQILQTNVGSVTRRAREPVSSSQIPFVFGVHELISLSYDFRQRCKPGQLIHLADVRSYLHEELESAFDLANRPGSRASVILSDPAMVLTETQSPISLANRLRDLTHANIRSIFDDRVAVTNQFSRTLKVRAGERELEMHVPSVTTSLAWAVVVESVLLNVRLNEDIKHVSMDPECGCNCQGEMVFCGPNPDPMARQVFADYVKCRWPIHVFALDPQSADQNVADSFSMRREMQLAVALAFAQGRMSAQNMTRYVRRIEMDMETVALNRTAAAFGHGKDVFGWRFYPRVQTPPFESTSTTVFRDMLRGGPNKDDLRRSWELEPGMRECTAVVLMPSFITHVTFDVRGNYFPLGRHKLHEPSDTRTSIEDSMDMSHKIRLMENAVCSITAEANCYRDGETQRLLRRADQIAKKLPLQTVHARVPNENTLGGFEMFSSGVTDLSPELLDFYGMPGINTNSETILYLVGDNFSVHETRVLAGNRELDFSLISRQVMQITVPAGVQVVDNFKCVDKERCEQPEKVVSVQISTPYGVSQPLEIPVINENIVGGCRWTRENMSLIYLTGVTLATTGKPETGSYNGGAVISTKRPFSLDIAVPPGAFPHPATAELKFVLTSPELGLSIKEASTPPIAATYNSESSTYQVSDAAFVALQKRISDLVLGWVNEIERGKEKKGGNYEIQVEATIQPAGVARPVPLENSLNLSIKVNVAP